MKATRRSLPDVRSCQTTITLLQGVRDRFSFTMLFFFGDGGDGVAVDEDRPALSGDEQHSRWMDGWMDGWMAGDAIRGL